MKFSYDSYARVAQTRRGTAATSVEDRCQRVDSMDFGQETTRISAISAMFASQDPISSSSQNSTLSFSFGAVVAGPLTLTNAPGTGWIAAPGIAFGLSPTPWGASVGSFVRGYNMPQGTSLSQFVASSSLGLGWTFTAGGVAGSQFSGGFDGLHPIYGCTWGVPSVSVRLSWGILLPWTAPRP